MVNRTLSHPSLSGKMDSSPRIRKYRRLTEAIAADDAETALKLSRASGWELDALKFISGLEFAYERFPKKKWYILADDDTYLVQPSLKPLLGHLDPKARHYLGNAVGDFRQRFAHGGSAIVLSQAAMQSLLVRKRGVVSRAHAESLEETWGDRLLARALIRSGIYLDERYSHLFNGESPRQSKIRADRFCSPVVAFHTLATPAKMLDAGQHFRNITQPVLWIDLWDIYQVPTPWRHGKGVAGAAAANINQNWDHVGEKLNDDDAILTVRNVASADECMKKCTKKYSKKCMAWTWETGTRKCHISPWMIVGEKADGKLSGPNSQRARDLEINCLGG
ncbi:hypothetical protein B0H66DRAFT_551363 [Apodospora peruviana]|uniref:N-acetylgalactosaminide beta-1,3-galactosyltransferase n=1 Tax=Apodospora peruviana TaxID=516989 RepID=A0AAE0IKH6_9PEZI|nr:hypothetical protein B0H66DRAFT_551363 [Apodospora peruviana]